MLELARTLKCVLVVRKRVLTVLGSFECVLRRSRAARRDAGFGASRAWHVLNPQIRVRVVAILPQHHLAIDQ